MERATREYNMEKLTTLKAECDEATRKFEECQDTYATDMFDFLAKEQVYTDKIAQVGWGLLCDFLDSCLFFKAIL